MFIDPIVRSGVSDYATSLQETPVVIIRGGEGALDRTTGRVTGVANPTTVWSGNARIKTISGSSVVDLGGGERVQRNAQISIPMDAPVPRRDDIVIVGVGDVADATVDNLTLRVIGANAGGLLGAARQVDCTAAGANRFWSPS